VRLCPRVPFLVVHVPFLVAVRPFSRCSTTFLSLSRVPFLVVHVPFLVVIPSKLNNSNVSEGTSKRGKQLNQKKGSAREN